MPDLKFNNELYFIPKKDEYIIEETWDYMEHIFTGYRQLDWNQTLFFVIEKISNLIDYVSYNDNSNKIKARPKMYSLLIQPLEYNWNGDSKMLDKYEVVFDNDLLMDEIIIYKEMRDLFIAPKVGIDSNELINPILICETEINGSLEMALKVVDIHKSTPEELILYKKQTQGKIKILNYE